MNVLRVVACCLLAFTTAFAQSAPAPTAPVPIVIVRAARLIDGLGGASRFTHGPE